MLRILRNDKGFTLIELVIIIILIGVLAAIAVPRYVDLRENAVIANAQATLDAGRAAIMLDFADDVLNGGTYVSPTTTNSTAGAKFVAADRTSIENLLQGTPNYPTDYDSPADEGFRWWLVTQGSTATASSPLAPVISAVIDVTCTSTQSITGGTTNDDCDVSAL
ncbi:MAG: prepilin-type N-terminal cleavage/methylation domain-containing protein [Candidatus Methylomirabilales bacterium]